jgi:hypothetical protein
MFKADSVVVFGVVFAFAFTSMQPIYPAEVMTNDMRAKGRRCFGCSISYGIR